MNTTISIVVAIIIFSVLAYLLLKNQASKSGKRTFDPQQIDRSGSASSSDAKSFNAELVSTKWIQIGAMQGNGPSGLVNALNEADKLLDYVMIHKGFAGDTMGDRLKSGASEFSNLNAVWSAHKLRNQLAHEVDKDVVPSQIKHAIVVLGDAIRGLGVKL